MFNNHVDLKIHYSKYKNPSTGVVSEDQFNIVLFEVVAKRYPSDEVEYDGDSYNWMSEILSCLPLVSSTLTMHRQ